MNAQSGTKKLEPVYADKEHASPVKEVLNENCDLIASSNADLGQHRLLNTL